MGQVKLMRKILAIIAVMAFSVMFSAGQKAAEALILSATVQYNGQPLSGAYVYYRPAGQTPLGQYFNSSATICGPTDASGNISCSIASPGAYDVMVRKPSAYHYYCPMSDCGPIYYGPPVAGDYIWQNRGSVTLNQDMDLGIINTTVYGGIVPITISGTVKGASGKPLAGWAVKAATVPCESGNWAYAHSFNECGAMKYPAWTDANGNYTVTVGTAGAYYVYASPTLNFANTNYPGGYPTCTTAVGCEACGDYYYFNCPVSVTSSVTGENITVPGY